MKSWAHIALCTLGLVLVPACNGADDNNGYNRCEENDDCPGATVCDEARRICIHNAPTQPYDLVLQVDNLPGGTGRLRRFTFEAFTFSKSSETVDLVVPPGRSVSGHVRRLAQGDGSDPSHYQYVVAEVSFAANRSEQGLPITPVVVTSRPTTENGGPNFEATIADGRAYQVVIRPLGEASKELPPVHATFDLSRGANGDQEPVFTYDYRDLETLHGVLVDESGAPRVGAWLRLLAGDPLETGAQGEGNAEDDDEGPPPPPMNSDQVVSSLAITDEQGHFTLHVLPNVLGARDYKLQVSLFNDEPWTTTIKLKSDRVVPSEERTQVVIPKVPERVTVEGKVEGEPLAGAVNASLTFISSFTPPSPSGAVNDRDWCKAHTLGDHRSKFECEAVVSVSAQVDGFFTARLLPGSYDVHIAPSRETQASRDTLTTQGQATIETQPGGGVQGGLLYTLEKARLVRGSIFGLSGSPLENALVRVVPTEGPNHQHLPGLTASDSVSNARGRFELPIDHGYCKRDPNDTCFDVVIQAPEQSGYPWLVQANRTISSSVDLGNFAMPAPTILGGQVRERDTGMPLKNITVSAFALVRETSTTPESKRGILVGRATTDADGNYELKLPPRVLDTE